MDRLCSVKGYKNTVMRQRDVKSMGTLVSTSKFCCALRDLYGYTEQESSLNAGDKLAVVMRTAIHRQRGRLGVPVSLTLPSIDCCASTLCQSSSLVETAPDCYGIVGFASPLLNC